MFDPQRNMQTMGVILNSAKLAFLGAAILVGAAGAASAADVYQRGSIKDTGDVYMPPITWTGFYVGVHAGAALGIDYQETDEGEVQTFALDDAFTGGLHAGYNWQTASNIVLGVEGSISLMTLGFENFDEDLSDYVASVRARLGYAFDQNLIYGTGGVAFLGYADDATSFLDEEIAVGFVVGAGFERKIAENLSFGVEGLYYKVESDGNADVELEDIKSDFWTVTARLNYHFNSGYSDPLK